jgi:hypothetical protein
MKPPSNFLRVARTATCTNHMDIPQGRPPRVCEYHAPLAFAPLDRVYRFDPQLQEYVRIPQGANADARGKVVI